jgi:hypothetical protein
MDIRTRRTKARIAALATSGSGSRIRRCSCCTCSAGCRHRRRPRQRRGQRRAQRQRSRHRRRGRNRCGGLRRHGAGRRRRPAGRAHRRVRLHQHCKRQHRRHHPVTEARLDGDSNRSVRVAVRPCQPSAPARLPLTPSLDWDKTARRSRRAAALCPKRCPRPTGCNPRASGRSCLPSCACSRNHPTTAWSPGD